MGSTHIPMGKYYWGIGASLLTLLAGGWLILAPFALGYQAGNSGSWTATTMNDFWVGIGLVIVAAACLMAFALALVGTLRSAGVVAVRPHQRRHQVVPAPAPASAAPTLADRPDLDQAMVALTAALEADLAERRKTENEHRAEPIEIGG